MGKDKKQIDSYGQPNEVSNTIAEDKDTIIYRPKMNEITGSVTATILLKQAMYWAKTDKNGFYKFIQPCKHEKYKKGDSWIEELGFTKHEFRTAIKKIGFKRGKVNNKIEKEEDAYIIYYTDSNRVTYWIINWKKLNKDIKLLYSPTQQLLPDSGNTKVNTESGNTKEKPDSGNTIITEITSEITSENTINKKEEEEAKFDFKLSTEKFSEKTLSLFKQVFGHHIRPYELKILNKYDLSDEVIRKGIELSGTHNAQSLQYLVDILDTWVNQGYKTLEDIERHIRAFKGEESIEDFYDKGYR